VIKCDRSQTARVHWRVTEFLSRERHECTDWKPSPAAWRKANRVGAAAGRIGPPDAASRPSCRGSPRRNVAAGGSQRIRLILHCRPSGRFESQHPSGGHLRRTRNHCGNWCGDGRCRLGRAAFAGDCRRLERIIPGPSMDWLFDHRRDFPRPPGDRGFGGAVYSQTHFQGLYGAKV
jgi:hypothetical protein